MKKDRFLGAISLGAMALSLAASLASGWVGTERMKDEVSKEVSKQVSVLPRI